MLTIWLALLAVGAAIVTGAVGYGFSSIVTPVGVLWYSNQLLNPAIVIVELGVNAFLLFRERATIRSTWPRAKPLIMTLLPGVLLGTAGLAYLAVIDAKLVVYGALLPLTALQLLGWSRPLSRERRAGHAVGPMVGFLYALTTISGPPLALFLRNQGLSKNEFRSAIAQIRVAESSLTLGTYGIFTAFFGAKLLSAPAIGLLLPLGLPVLLGIPLGALALRSLPAEPFRRLVMAVDGVLVSYGLSQVLTRVGWLSAPASDLLLGALLAAIAGLTYVALRDLPLRLPKPRREAPGPGPPAPWGGPQGPDPAVERSPSRGLEPG
jgi:uncharacterized protein